ncbi:hypothetical protein AB6A40_005854 [Gnathostoma spinigerum]|uniref:Major facilitator superfamily (MFS) profile domain-containing protein n=1 Tax=Gnathostoma spinigerum TaxID=75299 RepID=A0ABD6EGM4_9BILA
MLVIPNIRLLVTATIVSLGGSFHFGYQLVITNPSQSAFIEFLSNSFVEHYRFPLFNSSLKAVWSTIVASFFIGAIFGSLSLRTIAEKVGRKRGIYISITISIISSVCSIIAFFFESFELYTISRISIGYSTALALGLSAIYLNESSPTKCRGFISMITGVTIQLGTVIGSVVAMERYLGNSQFWWILYMAECVLFVLVTFLLPFMPESPSFLLANGDEAGARKSVLFFHNCDCSEVEPIIDEMRINLQITSKPVALIAVWQEKNSRLGVLVGVIISFSTAFSGIAVINAFAVDLLKGVGLSTTSSEIGNVILSAVSLIAIIISTFLVDHFGRRSLLLTANSAIVLINILISVLMYSFDTYKVSWVGYILISVISVFIIFFAIGPGPLCYFVTTEMVDQRSRAAAQSWASLTQMACRTVVLAIYLPMEDAVGQYFSYFILFVVPVFTSLVLLYFIMPETKNRNHIEVLEEISKLPSMRSLLRRMRIVRTITPDKKFEGSNTC